MRMRALPFASVHDNRFFENGEFASALDFFAYTGILDFKQVWRRLIKALHKPYISLI